MQFVVVPQIGVEAETPEEAVAKYRTEGVTISISCGPRPQPPGQPQPQPPGRVGATPPQR